MKKFLAEQPGGGFGNLGVLAPVVVFRPAVEMKMDDGRFRLWTLGFGLWTSFDKNRPGVARPGAVRRVGDKLDFSQVDAEVLENAAGGVRILLMPDEQEDFFTGGDFPNHLAINPRDQRKFSRPVAGLVRPGEPGRGVRLPFGGQGVAEFGGRGGGNGLHDGGTRIAVPGIQGNAETHVRRVRVKNRRLGAGKVFCRNLIFLLDEFWGKATLVQES